MALFSRKLIDGFSFQSRGKYAIAAFKHQWSGKKILNHSCYQGTTGRGNIGSLNMGTQLVDLGGRGRWHEILYQLYSTREYFTGKNNILADIMSRFAYPAFAEKQNNSWSATDIAENDAGKQAARELIEGRQLQPLTHFIFHANWTPEVKNQIRYRKGR